MNIKIVLRRLGISLATVLLYPISMVCPKDDNLWLFGSPKDLFADNSKYLFLWVAINCPDIRAVWVTGSLETSRILEKAGLPVALRWTLGGIWKALRARVFIYCAYSSDINVAASARCIRVNLWHGIGPKRLEHEATLGARSLIFKHARNPIIRLMFLERFVKPDLVASTTPLITSNYARGFQVDEARFLEFGTPRLDCALDERLRLRARSIGGSNEFEQDVSAGKRIALYMPTWRDTGRPLLKAAFPDPLELRDALKAANSVLYVKMHMNSNDDPEDLLDFELIKPWPAGLDVYVVIKDVDCLITDYSSVHYDFLLLKEKGSVIYDFDSDIYMTQDRGMFVPFDENVAGLRVRNFRDLCGSLRSGRAFEYSDEVRRSEVLTRFWGDAVPPACPKYVNHIRKVIEEGNCIAGSNIAE